MSSDFLLTFGANEALAETRLGPLASEDWDTIAAFSGLEEVYD